MRNSFNLYMYEKYAYKKKIASYPRNDTRNSCSDRNCASSWILSESEFLKIRAEKEKILSFV